MWERHSEGIAHAEIPRLMALHYGIDLAQAQHDFRKALLSWQAEGLASPPGCRHRHVIGGVTFSILYRDADILSAVSPVFSHLICDASPVDSEPVAREFDVGMEDRSYVLHTDGIEVLRSEDLDALVEKLTYSVLMCAYDNVSWLMATHAGAIGSPTACVLMPGASGRGKSTLTAALLSSGRNYYLTDDIALLDRSSLCVVPVPGALVLKSGSWEPLASPLPALSQASVRRRFGKEVRYWAPPPSQVAKAPLPVKAVVFARYEPGSRAALVPMSGLVGLSETIAAPCTVKPPITSETMALLVNWAKDVPFYALAYGSLAEAAQIVEELLWS
jgi:hypothetical protein